MFYTSCNGVIRCYIIDPDIESYHRAKCFNRYPYNQYPLSDRKCSAYVTGGRRGCKLYFVKTLCLKSSKPEQDKKTANFCELKNRVIFLFV